MADEPPPLPKSPTPEAIRAKNIEAVKQLLTEEEWADVRSAAAEEFNRALLSETSETLSRLKSSIGRLYGHFNNVMLKWGIVARNSYGKETPVSVPFETPPDSVTAPAKRARSVYRFDPETRHLIPVSSPIPPLEKQPTTKPVKRRNRSKNHPSKAETGTRRKLVEKQIKRRPSTLNEIVSRLDAEGFPVAAPYYAEPIRGEPRVRKLIRMDLYLLVFNGAAKREGERYSWVKEIVGRYYAPKDKK